jgi:hypothetical protein
VPAISHDLLQKHKIMNVTGNYFQEQSKVWTSRPPQKFHLTTSSTKFKVQTSHICNFIVHISSYQKSISPLLILKLKLFSRTEQSLDIASSTKVIPDHVINKVQGSHVANLQHHNTYFKLSKVYIPIAYP